VLQYAKRKDLHQAFLPILVDVTTDSTMYRYLSSLGGFLLFFYLAQIFENKFDDRLRHFS